MIKEAPVVFEFEDGSKYWQHKFTNFSCLVYVPENTLPGNYLNYSYSAPYLLYFSQEILSPKDAKNLSDKKGLSKIAQENESSVVFIYLEENKKWNTASEDLFLELISNTKIHEYYKDAYAILNNRFTKKCDGYAIRGAIFRSLVIGKGESANYIAEKLLRKLIGDGLWGKADVAPNVCILENLTTDPKILRRDMPIVSIGNNEKIKNILKSSTDYYYETDNSDYFEIYKNFAVKYKRWGWEGELQLEPDLELLGMKEEAGVFECKTSKDNLGDYKACLTNKIAYFAYYNKNLFSSGPVPLVLCFHGGGDSAKHMAFVSQWYKVCNENNFLLVCIENHLNSTATEMIDLIEDLKKKYEIDKTRIYASGFSMGACKTWDLYQEYPGVFAGLAPMSATFNPGLNVFGEKSPVEINQNILVPIFYVGGQVSPLPELPFQEEKCMNRMSYVFMVNNVRKEYKLDFNNKENWENKIHGVNGDEVKVFYDKERKAELTMNYFYSQNGKIYTAFGSVNNQGHECRYHSCKEAWNFISKFKRDNFGIQEL